MLSNNKGIILSRTCSSASPRARAQLGWWGVNMSLWCTRLAVFVLKDTTISQHKVLATVSLSKMAAEQEAALRMIQAVETALNPSTTQQQRIKAYEVKLFHIILRTSKY